MATPRQGGGQQSDAQSAGQQSQDKAGQGANSLSEMALGQKAETKAALTPIQQKALATDRAVQTASQANQTLQDVSAATHGRSAALPHLQRNVEVTQADLKTAVADEVKAHVQASLPQGQQPTQADYAQAMQVVSQRHQDNPASAALLKQAAPAEAGNASGPAAAGQKPQKEPTSDPTTPEGMKERFPDEMGSRSQQEQKEAADASRQLRDGNAEEKVQAMTTLSRYLPDKSVDSLSKELRVENNPTVQKVRQDTKARENMRTLADPKSSDAQRADAAIGLANRLNEMKLVPGKAGEVVKKYLKNFPSVESVTKSLNKLSDPAATDAEKASAVMKLGQDLGKALPGKVGDALKPFLDKLPGAQKAVDAYNVLSNPEKSAADKIKAGLDLADGLGKLAPEKLGDALKPYLSALPSGKALVDAITTWAKPDASALDKAKATLNLANAIKTSVGDAFPQLAGHLRYADSTLKSVGHALTLLDPNASLKDKAEAALGLTAEVPQIAGDLQELKKFLTEGGIEAANASKITDEIKNLPAVKQLPEGLVSKLDPAVAENLTPEQASRLSKLYSEGDKSLQEALGKTLPNLKESASVDALLSAVEGVEDKAARKGLLDAVGGLKPGMADSLLADTINGKPASEALAGIFKSLDGDTATKLAGMLADADDKAVRFALQMADSVDGKALKETLAVIGDSKVAGQALRAFANMMDKFGVKLTSEVASKLLKGLAKAVPMAGAIPAGIDAAKMAEIAADPNVPADIRYMALQAAKLNGVDAALSVAEPFIAEFGVPIAVDVTLAVAEVAMDVVVTSQLEQAKEQGNAYQAPDWLKASNVVLAAAQGPTGALELASIYGPEGATELVGAVSRMAGSAAIKGAEVASTLAAQGVGAGMKMTAEGMHALADMIRHPEKFGAAAEQIVNGAIGKLGELAKGAGELATAAKEQFDQIVGDLRKLGEKGLQTLGWIASHPGEAAQKAAQALSDMASEALRLGTEAGKKIVQGAMNALDAAQNALQAAGEAGLQALENAKKAIDGVIDNAIKAGEKGLETLAWIATHPGEAARIAKQGLSDLIAKGGELAQKAWNKVIAQGKQAVDAAMDIAHKLRDAGKAGVEMLQYIVNNPGEALDKVRQAALDGLQEIAKGVGEAAEQAVDAVTTLVDSGIKEAQKTAQHLLTEGGAAAQRIIDTWGKELSEGGKAVIDGLKDLGDAGAEALGKMADAGVKAAQDIYNTLKGDGVPFVPFI